MSNYQTSVDIIASLVSELDSIVRSDISITVRSLADAAEENERQMLIYRAAFLHLFNKLPSIEKNEMIEEMERITERFAPTPKPLQDEQMAAIINILNQPEKPADKGSE